MKPSLLEVGRIDRAHGIRGEVIVSLVTDRTERLQPGSVLQSERGPLEVMASRRHHHRWIVAFRGVEHRTGAEELAGLLLSAEPLDLEGVLWAHELIGCEVFETGGTYRGKVEELQHNPASDLLVLEGGALVPLRFVVEGPADGRLVVDVPPGLFDL